jgi:hypothetical protein
MTTNRTGGPAGVNRRAICFQADKSWQSRTSVTTVAFAGSGVSECRNVSTNSLRQSRTARASFGPSGSWLAMQRACWRCHCSIFITPSPRRRSCRARPRSGRGGIYRTLRGACPLPRHGANFRDRVRFPDCLSPVEDDGAFCRQTGSGRIRPTRRSPERVTVLGKASEIKFSSANAIGAQPR